MTDRAWGFLMSDTYEIAPKVALGELGISGGRELEFFKI